MRACVCACVRACVTCCVRDVLRGGAWSVGNMVRSLACMRDTSAPKKRTHTPAASTGSRCTYVRAKSFVKKALNRIPQPHSSQSTLAFMCYAKEAATAALIKWHHTFQCCRWSSALLCLGRPCKQVSQAHHAQMPMQSRRFMHVRCTGGSFIFRRWRR